MLAADGALATTTRRAFVWHKAGEEIMTNVRRQRAALSQVKNARRMTRVVGIGSSRMRRNEGLRRVAGDRNAQAQDRVAAIGELAQAVEPDVSTRAALWRDLLGVILFDESEDDGVRIAAAHAAAALGGVVVNSLGGSMSPDKPDIRKAIVATLQAIGQQSQSEYMEDRLHEDIAELENGLTTFPFINLTLTFGADRRIVPLLHRGASDSQAEIRASAVFQLTRIGDMAPATHALAAEPDAHVRAMAAEAIGYYWTGGPEPISALRDATSDGDPKVAKAAKSALRRLRLSKIPRPQRGRPPTTLPDPEIDPRFPWSELLRRWSFELCEDEAFALTQDDAVTESGWTGAEPVAEGELRDLEHRIGRTLPPSYRSFLMTTNGYVGGGSVERIRPAREVKGFADDESEWVDIWIETAGAGTPLTVAEHVAARDDDAGNARWQLLSDAIQVSDTYDGAVYLLCPTIVDDGGEWEAWLFATWLPGAARFPSWWDLLNREYRTWQPG